MNTIISTVAGVLLSIGSFLGIYHAPEPPPEPTLGAGTAINLAGTFPYFLAGSGISSSATSIVLTSFTLPQNSYPIQDADLDATFYLTIEPGNRTKQEFVSCTTVGTNTGGTATLSGCTRGLSPITPYTASSTLQFVHSGGSTVILSNPPQIYEDIYDYINNASFAGAVTASESVKGLAELSTAAEQAASTATGGSGPLVLQAQYATSTYNSATAANKTVVTGSGGFIDPLFIPTLATTSFSGAVSLSGVATSTFATASTSSYTSGFTWAKPSQLKQLLVKIVGSGAGGANDNPGGGGGGGAYCEGYIDAAELGSTETVTIGNVNTGIASSAFGSLIIAGNGATSTNTTGALGGDCSGSITKLFKIENFDGANGTTDVDPTPDYYNSGQGGGCIWGRPGQGTVTIGTGGSGSLAGYAGVGYGCGGSGGTGASGGLGAQGILQLTEIFN